MAAESNHLTIIPVSVLDVSAQRKRKKGGHKSISSRDQYSGFSEEVATLCCEFFLRDATRVYDPFAGWGERGKAVTANGMEYYGVDSSEKAIKSALETYGIQNHLGDSRTYPLPETFDGVLTCPPYWNVERYASKDGLDRHKTWDAFISDYGHVLARAYERASPGTTFCIVVGNWRKKFVYYDLQHETDKIMQDTLGAQIIDKVVVSRKKVSKIKMMLPQAKRRGYTVNIHEYLLVYRKVASED
jgi:DNA modification methylase